LGDLPRSSFRGFSDRPLPAWHFGVCCQRVNSVRVNSQGAFVCFPVTKTSGSHPLELASPLSSGLQQLGPQNLTCQQARSFRKRPANFSQQGPYGLVYGLSEMKTKGKGQCCNAGPLVGRRGWLGKTLTMSCMTVPQWQVNKPFSEFNASVC